MKWWKSGNARAFYEGLTGEVDPVVKPKRDTTTLRLLVLILVAFVLAWWLARRHLPTEICLIFSAFVGALTTLIVLGALRVAPRSVPTAAPFDDEAPVCGETAAPELP